MKRKTNSSHSNEILGGVTTFLTMSYIVVVNPSILATAGTRMSYAGVLTATVLLSFSMTLFMGLFAKLPFAVAPGMGINAFFTYSLILGRGVPFETALGVVFWAGVLFLLFSVTPIREWLASTIPSHLRAASAVGIGLFLCFIGLKNAGLVVADPNTLVRFGALKGPQLLTLGGLALMIFFQRRKNAGAFLIGIVGITVVGMLLGYNHAPEKWVSSPDFSSVLFKLDLFGALKLALLPALLSILVTDLFDSISTFVGVAQATGLTDKKGQPKNLREGLIVDAFATLFAGLLGTSSGTAYIESAAGIEAGGRTGRAAIVTALCFLPCLFIAPIANAIPTFATAPVLILVGAMMFKAVKEIRHETLEDLVPCFLVIVLIPLTFSITQGILWGFISHVVLYLVVGRYRDIHPGSIVMSLISVVLLVIESH